MSINQLRHCRRDEHAQVLEIINAAAERYRGVIPDDCWHEPYMQAAEFELELRAGVAFWVVEQEGALIGVMGIQPVKEVQLIRHAYVLPNTQRQGIGTQLLRGLLASSTKPVLVGTWAAARWAIDFYKRHGFQLVGARETPALLRSYWSISERQVATSVVLRFGH
jgi:N-acetylglutamate synthase-like GNAT family acetyltransferase